MTETMPPATDPGDRPKPQAGGIAGLARMSTTAGVGLQEYRAINPFAVTSLVLGTASILVWLHPLLYVLPAMALVFGATALWQISRSNATQSGTYLAAGGLLLGAGFALVILAGELSWRSQVREYRVEIQQMFESFGAALGRGDFDTAYSLTTEGFQTEVDPPEFRAQIGGLMASFGTIQAAGSNNLAEVSRDAVGTVTAEAMLIVTFADLPEPHRQPVRVIRTADGWRFQQIPTWFPFRPRPPQR